MNEKIYQLEDFLKLYRLQQQYENGLITEDDMSLEEINKLIKIYKGQIKELQNSIKYKTLHKKIGDQ